MKDDVKIIIADDNHHYIEGLTLALKRYPNCRVIGKYKNGKELSQSTLLPKADLIITDIEMPEMNGIQAARLINFEHPNLPMIALTMHIDKVYLVDIVKAGFKGFVHKPDVSRNLSQVIELVLANKFSFSNDLKIK